MIGDELEVLFETENHDGFMKGFSSNYVRVSHKFNPILINEFSTIKVKEINEGICEGEIVELKNAIDLKAC